MDLRSCSNQGSGSSRSQLPPCPKGSPSGGQPVLNPADGPFPPLTCQLGSTLLPCLPLASFCLPHIHRAKGHRRLPAWAGRELSAVTGKSHGRSAFSAASQKLDWIWKLWHHGVQRLHLRENSPLRVSVGLCHVTYKYWETTVHLLKCFNFSKFSHS